MLVDVLNGLAFFTLCFDLVTVKLNLHPSEAIPPPKDHLDAFDLMRQRRSCRSFQVRDLTAEHRNELLEVVKAQLEQRNLVLLIDIYIYGLEIRDDGPPPPLPPNGLGG